MTAATTQARQSSTIPSHRHHHGGLTRKTTTSTRSTTSLAADTKRLVQAGASTTVQKRQIISLQFTIARDFTTTISLQESLRLQHSLDAGVPCFVHNTFMAHKKSLTEFEWSDGSISILTEPNAGGDSELSEAASFEVLRRCLGSHLDMTEMEIEYDWCISKKTDYSIRHNGKRMGVSVTRAMKYVKWFDPIFTLRDALRLLSKKLYGVLCSTRDVITEHSWEQQILHVFTQDRRTLALLEQAYFEIEQTQPELIANTIVLCTLPFEAEWIFTNRRT